jgi:DNA invertase Pin-like site-specific DNA recombinase
MKLVAYLRVSTETQAFDGLGLDVQRKGISQWARANGHRVALWTADEGVSGSNGLDTRRGLLDALNAVEDGAASGLVVYKLDRLARSLTVQEGTLAKVWGLGGSVFSVDLGEVPQDDPDDPMRTAMRQMVGVFAQLERGMIAARMRAGRRLKAERGGYAQGAPPFGFRAEGGELVADDDEARTLVRIAELRSSGASLRVIADTLNAEGLRPKRSGRWHSETVRRAVARIEGGN